VNEQRAFEKWKAFEYGQTTTRLDERHTAHIQQKLAKQGSNGGPRVNKEQQGENENQLYFSTNSSS
jgi:hypothetical protein